MSPAHATRSTPLTTSTSFRFHLSVLHDLTILASRIHVTILRRRIVVTSFSLLLLLKLSESLCLFLVIIVREFLLRRHYLLIKHVTGVTALLRYYVVESTVDQLHRALDNRARLAVQLLFHELGFVSRALIRFRGLELVLELEPLAVLGVQLDRIQRRRDWPNELKDKADHMFTILLGHQILYVKEFEWICGLDKDHTDSLADILSNGAKLGKLIQLVKLDNFRAGLERLFNVHLVLRLELAVRAILIIATLLLHHHHHFNVERRLLFRLLLLLLLLLLLWSLSSHRGVCIRRAVF